MSKSIKYNISITNHTNNFKFSMVSFYLYLFFVITINFNGNIAIANQSSQKSKNIKIENNGKVNNVNLVYFNDSRYIDIEKIPNNIINKSKYNAETHTITSSDFRLQFLPGSFFYTLDNVEETKVVQLYLPIIVKSNSISNTNSKVKNKLYIPFVSFMKSLDSAGLYDVRYEIVNGEDVIKIKSKKSDLDFTVKFPKLNLNDDEIIDNANAAKATSDKDLLKISEDFWDEERIANYNQLTKNIEDVLNNNELAGVIGDIASKVFNSIKLIDKQKPEDNKFKDNNSKSISGTGNGGGNSKLLEIMPRYRGAIKQRKSYTDPFPNLKLENDNIKVKVYNPDKENTNKQKNETAINKPKTKTSKVKKEATELEESETNEVKNPPITKQKNEQKIKSETNPDNKNLDNKGYYLPNNLKRPGIDF